MVVGLNTSSFVVDTILYVYDGFKSGFPTSCRKIKIIQWHSPTPKQANEELVLVPKLGFPVKNVGSDLCQPCKHIISIVYTKISLAT